MLQSVHLQAVVRGAMVALLGAVPAALIARTLDGPSTVTDNSSWMLPLFLAVMASLVIGGYVAATYRPDAPLTHGALAAFVAYALAQAAGVIRLLIVGDPVNWATLPFFSLLACAAGTAGGLLADLRVRRPRRGVRS